MTAPNLDEELNDALGDGHQLAEVMTSYGIKDIASLKRIIEDHREANRKLTKGEVEVEKIRKLLASMNPDDRFLGVSRLRRQAKQYPEVDAELKEWVNRCVALQKMDLYEGNEDYCNGKGKNKHLLEACYQNTDPIEAILFTRVAVCHFPPPFHPPNKDTLGLGLLPRLDTLIFRSYCRPMPDWVCELNIKRLEFWNGVTSLSENIGQMKELEHLSLGNGSLAFSHLPITLANCTALKHLDLSESDIEKLPPTVHFDLEYLNLKDCKHFKDELPHWVSQVPHVDYP